MSGLIPQRFVEDLLDRVDLSELIGSRITLKKAGASYKACCPFHDEKTPHSM
nr:CHC2 zinc finger domain-containing protein [Marinobacter sp. AC-23]